MHEILYWQFLAILRSHYYSYLKRACIASKWRGHHIPHANEWLFELCMWVNFIPRAISMINLYSKWPSVIVTLLFEENTTLVWSPGSIPVPAKYFFALKSNRIYSPNGIHLFFSWEIFCSFCFLEFHKQPLTSPLHQ